MATEVIPPLTSRVEVNHCDPWEPTVPRTVVFGEHGERQGDFPFLFPATCVHLAEPLVYEDPGPLCFLLRVPSIEPSDSTDLDFYNFTKKNQ